MEYEFHAIQLQASGYFGNKHHGPALYFSHPPTNINLIPIMLWLGGNPPYIHVMGHGIHVGGVPRTILPAPLDEPTATEGRFNLSGIFVTCPNTVHDG